MELVAVGVIAEQVAADAVARVLASEDRLEVDELDPLVRLRELAQQPVVSAGSAPLQQRVARLPKRREDRRALQSASGPAALARIAATTQVARPSPWRSNVSANRASST